MGNTLYFLSNSREIPVFPAGMGNTHKSRDFANPAAATILALVPASRNYCDVTWSYHNVCAKFP